MKIFCAHCGELLPINGFVITPDRKNICFECKKKIYPTAFNNYSIHIYEDGTPCIVLPRGIIIPKEKPNYIFSNVSDIVLENYYHQIAEETKCSKEKIKNLVVEKIEALSGLVSEETALRILAQEFNIKLKNNFD